MSDLPIPFDDKNIKATYSSKARTLTVVAEGPIASKVVSIRLQGPSQVPQSGLKLNLLGSFGGIPQQSANISRSATWSANSNAPPSFKSVTVVVAADWSPSPKLKECPIPIAVDPPVSGGGGAGTGTSTAQVLDTIVAFAQIPSRPIKFPTTAQTLPPVNTGIRDTPSGFYYRIICSVPDSSVFRSEIEAHCEDNNLRIWRSGNSSGALYWDVVWANSTAAPDAVGSFTVVTQKAAVKDTSAPWAITIQPYNLSYTGRHPDPPPLVDSFDPNA